MTRYIAVGRASGALVLALCAACGGRTDDLPEQGTLGTPPTTEQALPAQPAPELPPLPPESIPQRPRTVADTLLIEGMPEPVTATLLRAPADLGMPFSTYVPPGIAADFEPAGDGPSIRFAAAFTGTADPRAYMHVRLYPAGTSEAAARTAATDFIRSRAPWRDEAQPAAAPPWGIEAYTYQYSGDGGVPITGRLVIGRHRDRFFHVLTHYPAEYGDGLGPRFQRILELWRWEDTGRMLERGEAAR
jgi:hypothetical protein